MIERGNGRIPTISIKADNLAEATHNAIIKCYEEGARVETPKHGKDMTLGYDANILIEVINPDDEPKICKPAIYDNPRGVMQYILEVTHGIHNHWKKSPERPTLWGYTYNERIVDQIPFILKRIESDWKDKGRISGRDYQFTTWRSGEDIIIEQDDPPCWQSGQLRFLEDENGDIVLNYQTHWRSRDLLKAWNENNLAQIELMKFFQKRVSNLLNTNIKLGSYIDHSDSLHLYGYYFEKDNLESRIKVMKEKGVMGLSLEEYLDIGEGKDRLKRLIGAQLDAEKRGYGANISEGRLEELGYDLEKFNYPKDWDTWPREWDVKPDTSKLARVI